MELGKKASLPPTEAAIPETGHKEEALQGNPG